MPKSCTISKRPVSNVLRFHWWKGFRVVYLNEEQPDYMLYWEGFDDPPPHESGKTMICGHASQKSGLPRSNGHAICIDTWANGDGWLTCLDVGTGEYWQANQRRETRFNWLD